MNRRPASALCVVAAVIVIGLEFILEAFAVFSLDTVVTEMYINGKNRNVTSVWAVLHSSVSLACDLSPPHPEDRPNLVLWYRGASLEPIYSFDARGVAFERGTPWTDDSRNSFRATRNVGNLRIDNVTIADSGIYRCRVDYQRAPATDYFFNVSLIVPPPVPTIVDSLGTLISSVSGVFKEGDALRLTCSVVEGWPIPTLTWKVDGAVGDSIQLVTPSGYPRSDFVIPSLTREDLRKSLTCEATNDNVTQPSVKRVLIDMNLPPIAVRIRSLHQGPLFAGQAHEFVCETIGSRPPPRIMWWLGSERLQTNREMTSTDGNISSSYLTLTPAVTDNGEILTCRADNKYLEQGSTAEHELRLSIHYKPIVKLKFGRNVDSRTIALNHDVYLECFIDANPKVRNIEWRHDGDVVRHDPANGIILANHTLVLQKIQRRSSGIYLCFASNGIGSVESNPVFLQVKYPPTCAGQTERRIALSMGEAVNVTCRVDGDPMHGMSFSWTMNTTKGLFPVPSELINDSRAFFGESSVVARASRRHDFGTLSCSAKNSIGTQPVPCLFHLYRGEKPDQLRNCTTLVPSPAVGAIVSCEPGPDGGMPPQVFHLEVYTATATATATADVGGNSGSSSSSSSYSNNYYYVSGNNNQQQHAGVVTENAAVLEIGSLVANLTSTTAPEFEIRGLGKGQQELYVCVAYSSNAKGASSSLTFGIRLDDVQWKDSAVKSKNRPQNILLSSALGSLGTGMILAFGCYCFAAKCYNRRKLSRVPEAHTWVAREHQQQQQQPPPPRGAQQQAAEDEAGEVLMRAPVGKHHFGNPPPPAAFTAVLPAADSVLFAGATSRSTQQQQRSNQQFNSSAAVGTSQFDDGVGLDDDDWSKPIAGFYNSPNVSTSITIRPAADAPVPASLDSVVSSNVSSARSSRRTLLAPEETSASAYNGRCITVVTTPQPLTAIHDVESIV